jgi:hypothetical protein
VCPCSPGPCRDQVPSESSPAPAPCPAAPTPARNAPHAAGDAARDEFLPGRARGPMPKQTARSPLPLRAPGRPGEPNCAASVAMAALEGRRSRDSLTYARRRSFEPPSRTARPAGRRGPAAAAIAAIAGGAGSTDPVQVCDSDPEVRDVRERRAEVVLGLASDAIEAAEEEGRGGRGAGAARHPLPQPSRSCTAPRPAPRRTPRRPLPPNRRGLAPLAPRPGRITFFLKCILENIFLENALLRKWTHFLRKWSGEIFCLGAGP